MPPLVLSRFEERLIGIKKAWALFAEEVELYFPGDNELTRRTEELCATIQRLEWAIDRVQRREEGKSEATLSPASSQDCALAAYQ